MLLALSFKLHPAARMVNICRSARLVFCEEGTAFVGSWEQIARGGSVRCSSYRCPARPASMVCTLCNAAIILMGLLSLCRSAARVQEMQTVVAIMLIGSVVMVAIAAMDQPNG